MSLLRAALVSVACAGCVATLPFDELSVGLPRPVAHYTLDDGAGFVAKDSAGPHQGLLDDYAGGVPTWTRDGRRGGGLDFPAADGWVAVPTLSGAAFPSRATFSAWVRLRAFPADGADVLEVDDDARSDDRTPIQLSLDAEGVFLVFLGDGEERLLVARPIPLGTWTLIAAGWDIAARTSFLYVRPDGAEAFPLAAGELPPRFGAGSASLLFLAAGGTLDDVRIFDRPLGRNELSALD